MTKIKYNIEVEWLKWNKILKLSDQNKSLLLSNHNNIFENILTKVLKFS